MVIGIMTANPHPKDERTFCECRASIDSRSSNSDAILAFVHEHEALGHFMMLPWWKPPHDGYVFMNKTVTKEKASPN